MSSSKSPHPATLHEFYNPSSKQLRALVLSYLCHHCYLDTARAFVREGKGRIDEDGQGLGDGMEDGFGRRLWDADGDQVMAEESLAYEKLEPSIEGETAIETSAEIELDGDNDAEEKMAEDALTELANGDLSTYGPDSEPTDDDDAELSEEELRMVGLRKQIRDHLLSGRVENARSLLTTYFPSVLASDPPSPTQSSLSPPSALSPLPPPTFPHSLSGPHLSLNLRIQAFIESVRTRPLYHPSITDTTTEPPFPAPGQAHVLFVAQSLFKVANQLPEPEDRALYLKELTNVSALMAYTTPETSPVSKYLGIERRIAVADQINSAVLQRTSHPPMPPIEHIVRHTSFLWSYMNENKVGMPPPTTYPPGLLPPPPIPSSTPGRASTVAPFDLTRFLDGAKEPPPPSA